MRLAERLLSKPASVKNTYIFNAAGAINAAVTMLGIQMLATRILGAEWAGRISADTTTVLLCYHLGQLNMRPYQCTDVKEAYSFSEYFTLKTMTVSLMILICLVYAGFRNLEPERCLFCLSFLAYKALASFSDCFWGMFQQRGRLDLAGLGMAVYELLGIGSFAAVLILTKRPGFAGLGMACLGLAHLLLYTLPIGSALDSIGLSSQWKKILTLITILVPLFAAGYFMNIAITIPKYALEMSHGEEALGIFAAVFMPAQSVLLASGFFFQPNLRPLAEYASKKDAGKFGSLLKRLFLAVVLLDAFIMVCAYLLAVPVLSSLFGLDFSPYRADIVMILAGGGFFALYTLFSYALIAMRKEKGMAVLAFLVLAAAAGLCALLTGPLSIRGAVLSYLFSMIAAALIFAVRTAGALAAIREGGTKHA